jgi:predicted O-methyltransferase YrrM
MIVTEAVREYIAGSRPGPDPVLAEMEAHAAREGIPVVVPETGVLLHVLAVACGALRIVEIGTAIGVSTLYMARAVPADGQIVSFEIDEGRHTSATGYLRRAGVLDRADLRLQDAREGLDLMSGTVAEGRTDGHWTDEQISQARAFNDRVLAHPQLAATLTPVGDGVLIAVRR